MANSVPAVAVVRVMRSQPFAASRLTKNGMSTVFPADRRRRDYRGAAGGYARRMEAHAKVAAVLAAVPETLLWTLYHRAVEARRIDSVIDDRWAVDLVERIDFPFAERFGSGETAAQWQALRARCFDLGVERFLSTHRDGTVVALGEGLETQFWRVDNGAVRWLSIDLPEAIDLR